MSSFHLVQRFFTLVIIAYAAYALLIFLLQRQILYPGRYIRASCQPPAGIVPITVITAAVGGRPGSCRLSSGDRGSGGPW